MSLATAEEIPKTLSPNIPMIKGQRRPINSEAGAHTIGPEANPRTKSVVPRVPTSLLTPNAELAASVPAAKIALDRDAWKVPRQTTQDSMSLWNDVCQCAHMSNLPAADHAESTRKLTFYEMPS